MFIPKTEKIQIIAKNFPKGISRLGSIFSSKTRIYIDYANVRPWSDKLKWHIDVGRLKQLLDSFDNIEAVNFYSGYLEGDKKSADEIAMVENKKYIVRTKPVKIMKFSINASSVPANSTALLDHFIRSALLRKYEISTVVYLNERFRDMNKKEEYFIEDRKCNFDVEIGVDMLVDYEKNVTDTFILWSGDSDFADPLRKILAGGKRAILFATAGRISRELNALKEFGLEIFDIHDIKEFICWNKEYCPERTKDPENGAL